MGLESGWNCHISLLSERSSNLESSRTMSFSAPSAINMEHAIVKFNTENEKSLKKSSEMDVTSQESIPLQSDVNAHDWQSLSCLTDSTEQSAPINFDMSNRAKLPRGIDKIRPHIELIDNVPLLVSLFTDCTPSATREMLHIMQDYGEIVCIFGSAENCDNCGIFMQSDASIAIEPLYPQVCQKREVYTPTNLKMLSPLKLSSELNSIACSMCVGREEPISYYRLIMEARHFVTTLWSSVQYWLCCCFILSLLELIAGLLMLPTVLTIGQMLWFCCIVIPLISLTLTIKEVDPELMKIPQGKIQNCPSWDVFIFIFWCYGTKFLPSIVVVLVSYIGILSSQCEQVCEIRNCTCAFFYIPSLYEDQTILGGWPLDSVTLQISRLVTVFILLLHFVVISIGFVHRDHSIIKKVPNKNLAWIIVIISLTAIQALYTIIKYHTIDVPLDGITYSIPTWVVIFAGISPICIFIINELIKHQEISVNKRFLKRARLDFGTKLGMNSPF